MLEEYLIMLYMQYCSANNIPLNNVEEYQKNNDFINWIVRNKILSEEYKKYLLYLDIPIYDSSVEVGKGKYDSIAGKNIEVVSPYGETLNKQNLRLVKAGNTALVVAAKRAIILPQESLLITHNPYEIEELIKWYSLHESTCYNISIGMYGSIYDKDKLKKIEYLMLMQKQSEELEINYDTLKDNYFCSLNSKRKTKAKSLIR